MGLGRKNNATTMLKYSENFRINPNFDLGKYVLVYSPNSESKFIYGAIRTDWENPYQEYVTVFYVDKNQEIIFEHLDLFHNEIHGMIELPRSPRYKKEELIKIE